MARITGVSSSTPNNLLVDAGAVYINYGEEESERLLGATRGGNSFKLTQEFRTVEADGIPGAINAMTRIINVEAIMTVRMLELSVDNLLLAFPGAEKADVAPVAPEVTPSWVSIRRDRNIASTDFLKNVAMVGTIQGTDVPIVIILYNAMQSDNIDMSTVDDDEAVIELNFRGHFDLDDFDTEPWEVRYPKDTSGTTTTSTTSSTTTTT